MGQNNYFRMNIDKLSITSLLLLPMLGDSRHRDWFFINEYFVDVFLGDNDKYEYNGNIILKYIFYPSSKYLRFERRLIVRDGIKAQYEYDDDMSVMYVFKIPDKHYCNFRMFLKGRYSEFNINFKLEILKFWNVNYGDTHLLTELLFSDKSQFKKEVKIYHHPC